MEVSGREVGGLVWQQIGFSHVISINGGLGGAGIG